MLTIGAFAQFLEAGVDAERLAGLLRVHRG